MGAEPSFDLAAAGLRADGRDLEGGVEVLARKLEDALPAATRVERRPRRLLSREKRVSEIRVALGDVDYVLRVERHGVAPTRAKTVRGVRIKHEELNLEGWLSALERDLREQAATSAEARGALERLLGAR